MRIYKGSSRTVLILGNLAFKFPIYINLWSAFWSLVNIGFIQHKWPSAKRNSKHCMLHFLRGIIANFTEFLCSIFLNSRVLTPVYFSIGFISIQKYQKGYEVTYQELAKRWKLLSTQARYERELVYLHNWEPENFRMTNDCIVMLDYGDTALSGKISIGNWLMEWSEEFEEVLSNKKPQN